MQQVLQLIHVQVLCLHDLCMCYLNSRAGQSRSGALMVAYLMETHDMSFKVYRLVIASSVLLCSTSSQPIRVERLAIGSIEAKMDQPQPGLSGAVDTV
jgi:hypothetical protein